MINSRINVGKTGASFAECGSSCDRSRLFANTKFNQKRETTEQVNTPIRMHAKNILKVLSNKILLKISKWKFSTLLDYIATNNAINDNICKSKKKHTGWFYIHCFNQKN